MTGSVDQPIQNSVTESKYFVGVPYLAAIKHACVHNIGAHKSCFHSFDLLGQQSMGQRLVEAHCSKLTGTVILSKEKNKTYTVIKYSYRIIFNPSDLVSLLFFEFEFVTSFADSSKKTEKKNWHNEAVKSSWCSDASPFLGHLDTSGAEEAEDTGDGHDVSMILGLHLREECLHCLRHTNTYAAVYFKATNCHLYMT